MKGNFRGFGAALVAVLAAATLTVNAQAGDKFSARLGWVPTAGAGDRANVTGKGMATATLAGNKLTINGTFEGLAGAATVARLHQGAAKGARGKAFADVEITKATSGTITGSVTLTPEQLEALKQGRVYLQVHSEKGVNPEQGKPNPDTDHSNLWGWFLK